MTFLGNVRDLFQRADGSLTDCLNKHKKIRILIDIAFVLLVLVFVNFTIGFWMDNNDESTIAGVMAGYYTKEPYANAIFTNIIYGKIISFLYTVVPALPWYGIIQILFIFLMLALPLIAIEQRCNSAFTYLMTMLVGCISILSLIKVISQVQFTTISALMAISGYLCLSFYDKKVIKYVSFVFLEAFAYFMRDVSMYMIQPVGYAFFVAAVFALIILDSDKRFNLWKFLVKVIPPFLIILAIVGVGKISSKYAKASEDWNALNAVSRYRSYVADVYQAPAYNEVKDILDKYGISETEYNVCSSVRMLDPENYNDALAEVNNYIKSVNSDIGEDVPTSDIVRWFFVDSYKGHEGLLVLYGVSILIVLLSGEYRMLLSLFVYFLGKILPWCYIFMRQRMIDRVMIPLYFSEYIFLLSFIFLFLRYVKWKISWTKVVAVSISVLVLLSYSFVSLRFAKRDYVFCKNEKPSYEILNYAMQSVADFCDAKEDVKYIVSLEIMSYWKYPLFSVTNSNKSNYVVLGGWFSITPGAQEYMKEYLKEGSIHLLVSSDPVFEKSAEYLLDYFTVYYGSAPVFEKEFYNDLGDYAKEYVVR